MLQLVRDAVEWRQVEGEIVALDLRDSMYLSINPSGAVLWPKLVNGTERDDLVATLRAEYGIDEATAGRDVDAFLTMLRERELLHESAPAS